MHNIMYTGDHFAATWREFARYFPPEFRAQCRHHADEHSPLDLIRMRIDCLPTVFVLPEGGNKLASCPRCGRVDAITAPDPFHYCSNCALCYFPMAVVVPIESGHNDVAEIVRTT